VIGDRGENIVIGDRKRNIKLILKKLI